MQLTSIAYVAFLALSVAVYYALPGVRARTAWLLVASFAFYLALSGPWTLLLVAEVAVGYVAGRAIERTHGGARRVALAVSVGLAVGMLVAVRVFGFMGPLFAPAGPGPALMLLFPIGVSFWTLQTVAYLIDVYRGTMPAERRLARYALLATFFPYVTAGPIPRAADVLPQLAEKHGFDADAARSGTLLIVWGALKKLVVADSLGIVVESVYRAPRALPGGRSGLVYLVATVAFAIQIYCDFSGYTDIARGSARLFGVRLLPNFDRPFLARSVREFWKKWHMSLQRWLRDYVYIPLGGNRVPTWRRYLNVLAVYVTSGLWHGASVPLLVWALYNGAVQVAGDATKALRDRIGAAFRVRPDGRLRRVVQTVVTLLLVLVGWVFFRAQSLADALYILSRMLVPTLKLTGLGHLGLTPREVVVAGMGVVLVLLVEHVFRRSDVLRALERCPVAVRWAAYTAAVVVVFIFALWGPAYAAPGFIYWRL